MYVCPNKIPLPEGQSNGYYLDLMPISQGRRPELKQGCHECQVRNFPPSVSTSSCYSCGHTFCELHVPCYNATKSDTFACSDCLEKESVRTLIKRKRRCSLERDTWEHNLKRRKLEEEPPTNQLQTISLETMNQIIWSINPNAFPLSVRQPIVKKKKLQCITQTPDKNLIARTKQALTLRKISQKQLAGILVVSPSLLSNYLRESKRINGWKEFEQRVEAWLIDDSQHSVGNGVLRSEEYTNPSNDHEITKSSFYQIQMIPQYYEDLAWMMKHKHILYHNNNNNNTVFPQCNFTPYCHSIQTFSNIYNSNSGNC